MESLRLQRIEIGLSQIELSEAARVPRYKVQLSERGIACLSDDEARRLAQKLGLCVQPLPESIRALIEED